MRLIKFMFIILSSGLIFSSCTESISVSSDYDQSAEFESYKTFMMLPWPEENNAVVNEFDKERILNGLKNELIARGITESTGSGADIAVNIFVTTEQKTETQAYTNYYNSGYGYYYSPYMGMGGSSTTTVRDVNYLVGTVIIDIFEIAGKKLVWQGIGQGVVNESPNAKQKEENVDRALSKIMAPYPVAKLQN